MKKIGLLAIVLACGLILTGCELFHEPEVCCTANNEEGIINNEELNNEETNVDVPEIIDLK